MTFSRRAKLAIAAALALTLGGKAAFSREAPAADAPLFTARATEHLRANGFLTRSEDRAIGTVTWASAGACRLMLADYPPHGTMAEPLGSLAAPIGPLRFVWRGELLDEAPKVMPLTSFFVQRELRRIGLSPLREPLIAVAGSAECDLQAIDWGPLAALPA